MDAEFFKSQGKKKQNKGDRRALKFLMKREGIEPSEVQDLADLDVIQQKLQ